MVMSIKFMILIIMRLEHCRPKCPWKLGLGERGPGRERDWRGRMGRGVTMIVFIDFE